MLQLKRDINELELKLKVVSSRDKQQIVAIIQTKYNNLSTNKGLVGLTILKQTYQNQREKEGKLLA